MGSLAWRGPDCGQGGTVVVGDGEAEEHLLSRVRGRLLSPGYVPPELPPVTLALIELATRPEVAFGEALAMLQHEPALGRRVLEVARSPLYARGRPPATLELALTRLGLQTASHVFLQVVVTACLFEAAPRYAAAMEALRAHSVLVGHATRLICRAAAIEADHAFLTGLLHDVGLALGAIALEASTPDELPPFDEAVKALAPVHEAVAAAAAVAWRLPAEVAGAFHHHHDPVGDGRVHPVGAAVQLADAWATELGFSAPGERSSMSFTTLPVLDLGARDLARLRASVALFAERVSPR